MRKFFILFLSCLSCSAQFVVQQPFLLSATTASTPFNPSFTTNLGNWWVSSDIETNIAVTNWIDRISGAALTNGSAGNRPTNSALGVHFVKANNNFLTNNPGITFTYDVGVPSPQACTLLLICNLDVTNVTQMLWSRTYSSSTKSLYINASAQLSVTINPTSKSDGPVPANNWMDIIVVLTNGPSTQFYTNGIASGAPVDQNLGNGIYEFKSFGGNSAQYANAYFREMAVWTNYCMDSVTISNIHWYATNTYGYGP